MLVYKIHPAIGVARVGNSPSSFFIGPEKPGEPGVEIGPGGAESPVVQYKENGQIKRQAARFRIFEFDQDAATGRLTLTREITAADARITWKAELVNRKAAFDRMITPTIDLGVAPRPRNTDLTGTAREQLVIRDPRPHEIEGVDQSNVLFDQGSFLGVPVFLGELKTDAVGRLIVLGGRGVSGSVPAGRPIVHFANNNRWHDDVADGPVTANVTFPGQPTIAAEPAWVTVAPPDFAPGVEGIVTLYDVAFQAAIDAGFTKADARPTFQQHIMPVILRAANLRFTHKFDVWKDLPRSNTDLAKFAKTVVASKPDRQFIFDALMPPNIEDKIDSAVIPDFLKKYFDQYLSGDFLNDLGDPLPVTTLADDLDRAALDACVGLNFFPGIEGSLNLRDPEIYSAPFRINHGSPSVFPGFLTEVMAVPWQADFLKCHQSPSTFLAWWPSQRPDIVMKNSNSIPGSQSLWESGITNHQEMIDKFSTRSFVVPKVVNGETVFIEQT